jgi:hypothetical protein
MRRTLFTLGALLALQACTSTHRTRDAAPPADMTAAPAPGSGAAAARADAPLERSYRSAVTLCLDAALRVCRESELQVSQQERSGDQSASLRAQGRTLDFTLAFARTPANRTRATLQLGGRALPEHREEATRLLDRLGTALLEPRD